ncbi:MAG: alpha/beta hydrolase, partial [Dehalococcoidia bacterium]
MPQVPVNGVNLYVEETGAGTPLVFVHEFAGDSASWHPQVRFLARRYRCITYNARGYPPSDVPDDIEAYSQDAAVEDLRGVLDALDIEQAHVCGLSMGAYATLHFGLRYPERARSLVVAGAGYGSGQAQREAYEREMRATADRFRNEGMAVMADVYTRGPGRVPFMDKDPLGYREFRDQFAAQSALGHALTLEGVQLRRPTVYDLGDQLARLTVPTLIVTGDEDEPCLEPAVFMKRTILSSGLVVIPKSGHTINLEEPEAFNRAVLDFITAVDAGRWPLRNPASVVAGGSQVMPV